MPYHTKDQLPAALKSKLPDHAQDIYMRTFNAAWDEYGAISKSRGGDNSKEETAHRIAWAAVKQKFIKKADGEWKEKEG